MPLSNCLVIQSRQNPRIKDLVRLKDDARERRKEGLFVIEGSHELMEAILYGIRLSAWYLSQSVAERSGEALRQQYPDLPEPVILAEPVFEKVSGRQNPDGILAVGCIPAAPDVDAILSKNKPVLILEGVEKPGNLGAIIRSAAAFGVDAIFLNRGKVDPWHPQVIRNSRGHSMGLSILELDPTETYDSLKAHGYSIGATTPQGDHLLGEVTYPKATAWVFGSEHSGLDSFWLNAADHQVRIPMPGTVDSLNVGIAVAIVLYEMVRNR